MKKFYYIMWILLFTAVFQYSYADECSNSCMIADAPAPALTEYFTNLESIQSNILEVLSDAESNIISNDSDEETSQIQAEWEASLSAWKRVLQSFNSLLSFNDYYGSFDFKIALPITNEVPNEVKREQPLLETISI